MADKSFGVKDINLIGASGVPTIDSPNNLNINAVNVAISTDMSVGGTINVGSGTSISSPGTNILSVGTGISESFRVDSNGHIRAFAGTSSTSITDLQASFATMNLSVANRGGSSAINVVSRAAGAGQTNIVLRSIASQSDWAGAEFRAEDYSFKIRTTERFRIDFDGTVSDSMGPLRRLGINYHNAATYTLVASDAGKLVREATNSANITIPQNVFSAGDMISIFNVSGGNNTITSGAGITLYNTSGGATGNRTLAAKGVCTIVCTSTNEFIISGSGLS
jgi:hypothetical protein